MTLSCPQRSDHLRLVQAADHRPGPRRRTARAIAIRVLALVFTAAGAALLPYSPASAGQTRTATHQGLSASATAFCPHEPAAGGRYKSVIAEIEAAGGLVHLLARRQAAAPFECAAYYLAHGLDVNAIGNNGLTALHYAIRVNSPEMLRFVIAHGADLRNKAGANQLAPMSYAYYLALSQPATDRSRVIAILSDALAASRQ